MNLKNDISPYTAELLEAMRAEERVSVRADEPSEGPDLAELLMRDEKPRPRIRYITYEEAEALGFLKDLDATETYASRLESTNDQFEMLYQEYCLQEWTPADTMAQLDWLRKLSSTYVDHFASLLKRLPYLDFLATRYWKIISNHVKAVAGFACGVCPSTLKLEVHHRIYEHHGYEHIYIKDLVCLCHVCHAKIHGKPA